jgi:PAS domain-containing protein
VPHVELSVSEPHLARPRLAESSLDRWATAVADAAEPSLVIDEAAVIVAISASFEDLLGLTQSPVDRPLLDGVLQLLDFADGGALDAGEIAKTPPLLALSSGRLARGLVRVRCASGPCTFDAIATPLVDEDNEVCGSLTFFSTV